MGTVPYPQSPGLSKRDRGFLLLRRSGDWHIARKGLTRLDKLQENTVFAAKSVEFNVKPIDKIEGECYSDKVISGK